MKDASDNPLPDAIVQLKNIKTSKIVDFATKDDGKFVFRDLPMDINYELTGQARRRGYAGEESQRLRHPQARHFEFPTRRPPSSNRPNATLVLRRVRFTFGAWLSLARAPGSGPGGRWFESTRPDQFLQ